MPTAVSWMPKWIFRPIFLRGEKYAVSEEEDVQKFKTRFFVFLKEHFWMKNGENLMIMMIDYNYQMVNR